MFEITLLWWTLFQLICSIDRGHSFADLAWAAVSLPVVFTMSLR